MAWTRNFNVLLMHPNLEEVRSAMRITGNELDGQLLGCLKASAESCEKYIGRIIARSMFTYTGLFTRTLNLKAPVIEVTSVKVDGVLLPSTSWSVAKNVLTIAEGVTGSRMEVKIEAGMLDVPYDIRDAVTMRAIARFENPGDSIQEHFNASDNLLRPYRQWEVNDD